MTLKKVVSFPLHIFLLPVFFVLHVVNDHYGLLPTGNILRYLSYYLLFSIGLFLPGLLVSRSFIKAGNWTTLLLMIFFFYGAAHDFLKNSFEKSFFSSYTFTLSVVVILIILISLLLRRRSSERLTLSRFLNILFGIFVFIEVLLLGFKGVGGKERENNFALLRNALPDSLSVERKQLPDIFFIVFDEYASSVSLKKYLGFDNSKIDSILRANRFYISTYSKSNYNSTPFSLASTFTLDYLPKPLDYTSETSKLRLQAFYTLKWSKLFSLLKGQDYRIVNLGLTDIKDKPVKTFEFSVNDKKLPLYLETLWGRVYRDLGWHFLKWFPTQAAELEKKNQEFIERNEFNLQSTLQELKVQGDTPKIIITHVMLPHGPFLLDSSGKRRNLIADYKTIGYNRLYLDQVMYTNKWITDLAASSNQDFPRPRVVVMEGDHGFRDIHLSKTSSREKECMNLNTYFFSDGDYRLLYDSISPVNSFRVVMNKYFGMQLPLLKDSSILLK